jgi:hypothetical protein
LNDWDSKPRQGPTKQWWVVCDGQAGPRYDLILDPSLSGSDNDANLPHVFNPSDASANGPYCRFRDPALYVNFGPADWRIALHGASDYHGVIFDAPDRLHYLAVKERGVYLVEQTI